MYHCRPLAKLRTPADPVGRQRSPELRDFSGRARIEYGQAHVRRWQEYGVGAVPGVRPAIMSGHPAAARSYWCGLVDGWAQRAATRRTPIGRMRCSHAAARKADSDPPR